MNNDDKVIVRFMNLLAMVRKQFGQSKIFAVKQPYFKNITTTSGHFNQGLMYHGNYSPAVFVSFHIDSEFIEVTEEGKKSLEASIIIYYVQNEWFVEGEVGWNSDRNNWEAVYEYEMTSVDYTELEKKLMPFVDKTLETYNKYLIEHCDR